MMMANRSENIVLGVPAATQVANVSLDMMILR